MVISPENILLVGAILLFLSVLVGKTGAKFGVPALLLFLGVGMLAGSDGFGIYFDSPQIAQFIGTVALCIILFFGWNGYTLSGNKTNFSSGCDFGYVGSFNDNDYNRIIHLFVVRSFAG